MMWRLSSEQQPLVAANSLQLFHGGAAYNFVYAMKRTFGFSTSFLSALPADPPSDALYRRMLESGADLSQVRRMESSPQGPRLGINWTDSGFGNRPPQSHADRAGEALGFLDSGDFNLDQLFGTQGVRWFHTDGITPGISDQSSRLVEDILRCAKEKGTVVSYDLNYRHAVWKTRGGASAAAEVNRSNLKYCDVLFAGVGNLLSALGVEFDCTEGELLSFEKSGRLVEAVAREFPHLGVIATTWRNEIRSNLHQLGALLWMNGKLHALEPREFQVLDRVGSGDAFDAGVAAALFQGEDPNRVMRQGCALSGHCLSTSGDLVRATESDLAPFLEGGRVRIER